jgi:UPF0755 protein
MSNVGLSMRGGDSGDEPSPPPPRRKGRSALAVAAAVVVLAGLVAVVGYVGFIAYEKIQASAPAEDYPGPGKGKVVIEIATGETLSEIGETLLAADVVASVEAFTQAAAIEPDAISITPGSYSMKKQMSGEGAVARLLNPKARNEFTVLIPEGWRTDQTVAELSKVTGIPEKSFYASLQSESRVPLPSWAKGNGEARVEGFLFPAIYTFEKEDEADAILNSMVDRFNVMAKETKFAANSRKLGYPPYEVLTIASLVQAEGVGDDYADIAGAIYNRLNPDYWSILGTNGRLDIDATVNYIFKQSELNFTEAEKSSDSPYNTYVVAGLPPTPINSPGEKAVSAALNPTESDWLWWVHGPDGQTCLAETFSEHEANIQGECKWE